MFDVVSHIAPRMLRTGRVNLMFAPETWSKAGGPSEHPAGAASRNATYRPKGCSQYFRVQPHQITRPVLRHPGRYVGNHVET